MPKLYSSKDYITALKRLGFRFISQKGLHAKYKGSDGNLVIIPMAKKEIPFGTHRSILKQAGVSHEIFLSNL